MEGSHKGKNVFFFISGQFFSKYTSFVFMTFFSHLVVIQSTQFFSVVRIYKMFLMKHFSS